MANNCETTDACIKGFGNGCILGAMGDKSEPNASCGAQDSDESGTQVVLLCVSSKAGRN